MSLRRSLPLKAERHLKLQHLEEVFVLVLPDLEQEQPVWFQDRRGENGELSPNGKILDVRLEEEEVDVIYEDGGITTHSLEAFDVYNDVLGRWMIYSSRA